MTDHKNHHRAGVLVVDDLHVTIVDLDTGEVSAIELAELDSVWSRPELAPVGGEPLQPPAGTVPLRSVSSPAADLSVSMPTPVALRLDARRLLAWDPVQRSHVELTPDHVAVLFAARDALTFGEADLLVPDGARRLAELAALSVVSAAGAVELFGDPEQDLPAEPLTEPDGSEAQLGQDVVDDSEAVPADAAEPTGNEPEPPRRDDEHHGAGTVAEQSDPESDAAPERLPSIFADLPEGKLATAHVLAYRVVGRTRRAVRAQVVEVRRRRAARLEGTPQPDVAATAASDRVPASTGHPTEAPSVDDEAATAAADVVHTGPDSGATSAAAASHVGDTAVAGSEPDTTPSAAEPDAPTAGDEAPEAADVPDVADVATDEAQHARPQLRPAVASVPFDHRVPVIPLYRWGEVSDDQGYGEMVEPSLSVGMLFAMARHHDDGSLNEKYDLRKIRPFAYEVLAEWEQDPRPAVFVFSDYLWNVKSHLEMSQRVKELSPESICLHGGPSVPKYDDDVVAFFAENPSVDVAAHGEGEYTFVEILEALDGALEPGSIERLADTAGITFRRPTADGYELVSTAERERTSDLDQFPSPYLTGEFDDLLSVEWRSASIETNRGCPYGCTYCDWGSATLARIRKFDLDRVLQELEWIQQHAAPSEMHIADANFGIFSRDVTIAEHIASLRQRYGAPYALAVSLAKNTVKYSTPIIETLISAGVSPITATSAVQTVDPETLIAIERQNIKLEKYDELAVTFKEMGVPLVTDLLMGLPGATVESFKNDLQHCYDRQVTPRTMEIIMLPNSPMNEPGYRSKYELQVDEHGVIVGSSTYSRADYDQMRRLRLMYRAADHFGVLRHVLRFLQLDHGIRALDVLADLDERLLVRGNRYPLLAFVARAFDLYTMPPVAWEPFYDEFVEFLGEQYGIELTSDLAAVLRLQRSLAPAPGRTFPEEIELEHDVVAYLADHRTDSELLQIKRPLKRYAPATFTVRDPGDICNRYVRRNDFPGRRTATTGNLFWVGYDWELDSPLVRQLATNVGRFERASA